MCISHENPEFHGAKRRFLPFLCIAKRVTDRRTALFSRAVNSNCLTFVHVVTIINSNEYYVMRIA